MDETLVPRIVSRRWPGFPDSRQVNQRIRNVGFAQQPSRFGGHG